MLERHSNKRATWRWRSLFAPLSQRWKGTGGDVWEKSFRTRTFGPLRAAFLWHQSTRQRGCPLSARPSFGSPRGHGQGDPRGEARQSLQPWLSPPGTCQTLRKQPDKGFISFGWKNRNIYTSRSCLDRRTFTGHAFLCAITFLKEKNRKSIIFKFIKTMKLSEVWRGVPVQNPHKVAFHASFHTRCHHNTQGKETSGAQKPHHSRALNYC